ncbi:MAG TPA: hypothetical protein VIF15_20720 [Polyangiaceae bacterium]|jgi:hypothetical protein
MADVVLAFPPNAVATRAVRSTVILGSMAALRDAGHYDAWSAALAPEHRRTLVEAVAAVWLPLDAALAYYAACDSLHLSSDAVARLGGATFTRVQGTLLGTVLRMANGAGVTPWTVLPQLQRFWDRAYVGGGVQVTRRGPKDAQLVVARCALAESHYYRNALRGLTSSVLSLFCHKVYVQEEATARPHGTVAMHAQWV